MNAARSASFGESFDLTQFSLVWIVSRYVRDDARGTSRSASVETGFGQDVLQPQKPVERKIDVVHESLTIRYDRTDPKAK